MRHAPARDERAIVNRLTAATLALQILERRTPLSDRQRRLVRAALEATDGLGRELLYPSGAGAQAPARRGVTARAALPSVGGLLRSLAWSALRGSGGVVRLALTGRSVALRAQGPSWRELQPKLPGR